MNTNVGSRSTPTFRRPRCARMIHRFRRASSSTGRRGLLIAVLIAASLAPILAGPASAGAGSDTLYAGEVLANGRSLSSSNGYRFVMQSDGNGVVYKPTSSGAVALWASNTSGRSGTHLVMQTDGNLVMYGPNGAYWASNTAGRPGTYLAMQSDGNLVMYQPVSGGRTAVWRTNTAQSPSTPPTTQAPGGASGSTVSTFKMSCTAIYDQPLGGYQISAKVSFTVTYSDLSGSRLIKHVAWTFSDAKKINSALGGFSQGVSTGSLGNVNVLSPKSLSSPGDRGTSGSWDLADFGVMKGATLKIQGIPDVSGYPDPKCTASYTV